MKILKYLFIGIIVLSTSCSSTKTSLFGGKKKESSVQGTSINKTLMPATPIKEVEETLVSNEDKAPGPEKYFVIIGSFKDPANARDTRQLSVKTAFHQRYLKMKPDCIAFQ